MRPHLLRYYLKGTVEDGVGGLPFVIRPRPLAKSQRIGPWSTFDQIGQKMSNLAKKIPLGMRTRGINLNRLPKKCSDQEVSVLAKKITLDLMSRVIILIGQGMNGLVKKIKIVLSTIVIILIELVRK